MVEVIRRLIVPGWMAGLLTAVLYAAVTPFLALCVPEQGITVVQSTKQQVQEARQAGSASADDAPATPVPTTSAGPPETKPRPIADDQRWRKELPRS